MNFIFTHKPFQVNSSGLINGVWKPKYGAASSDKIGAMPIISVPLQWKYPPKNTKSFALTLIDYDTVPIIGFPWIHWLACNIPSTTDSLLENASQSYSKYLCQGVNSFSNGYVLELKDLEGFRVPRKDAYCYGGFVPVDFPHKYVLTLYALDTCLELKDGYMYNEFLYSIYGHVLDECKLCGVYDAKIFNTGSK